MGFQYLEFRGYKHHFATTNSSSTHLYHYDLKRAWAVSSWFINPETDFEECSQWGTFSYSWGNIPGGGFPLPFAVLLHCANAMGLVTMLKTA